jgi:hypothetical protein
VLETKGKIHVTDKVLWQRGALIDDRVIDEVINITKAGREGKRDPCLIFTTENSSAKYSQFLKDSKIGVLESKKIPSALKVEASCVPSGNLEYSKAQKFTVEVIKQKHNRLGKPVQDIKWVGSKENKIVVTYLDTADNKVKSVTYAFVNEHGGVVKDGTFRSILLTNRSGTGIDAIHIDIYNAINETGLFRHNVSFGELERISHLENLFIP